MPSYKQWSNKKCRNHILSRKILGIIFVADFLLCHTPIDIAKLHSLISGYIRSVSKSYANSYRISGLVQSIEVFIDPDNLTDAHIPIQQQLQEFQEILKYKFCTRSHLTMMGKLLLFDTRDRDDVYTKDYLDGLINSTIDWTKLNALWDELEGWYLKQGKQGRKFSRLNSVHNKEIDKSLKDCWDLIRGHVISTSLSQSGFHVGC